MMPDSHLPVWFWFAASALLAILLWMLMCR